MSALPKPSAVCFAAGLAKGGLKPVVVLYSTFLQRAYDQIIEDVALQNLPVVFCLDRAGIVGEDGVTHQGIFDLSFPEHGHESGDAGPKDAQELEMMLEFSIGLAKPVVIRYPKGKAENLGDKSVKIELGRAEIIAEGKDFIALALGNMVAPASEANELLKKDGLSGTIINARALPGLWIKHYSWKCPPNKNLFLRWKKELLTAVLGAQLRVL